MSIESWKAEFCPSPKVPKDEAAEHCLQRWIGFLPENIDRHSISVGDVHHQRDCALCEHWWDLKGCPGCPYVLFTGENCCDDGGPVDCLDGDDPGPGVMILDLMALVAE